MACQTPGILDMYNIHEICRFQMLFLKFDYLEHMDIYEHKHWQLCYSFTALCCSPYWKCTSIDMFTDWHSLQSVKGSREQRLGFRRRVASETNLTSNKQASIRGSKDTCQRGAIQRLCAGCAGFFFNCFSCVERGEADGVLFWSRCWAWGTSSFWYLLSLYSFSLQLVNAPVLCLRCCLCHFVLL